MRKANVAKKYKNRNFKKGSMVGQVGRKRITALTLALLAMLVFGLSAAPVSSAPAPPGREERVGSPDPQHAALEREDSSSAPLGNPTSVIYPTDDADVYERYPDTNYGSDTSIYVRPYDSRRNRGFLKFDLSGISEDTIDQAKLHLYCWRKRDQDFEAGCYEVDDDSWSEYTITWDNQPSHGSWSLDTEWIDGTGWYVWDVTGFVRQEFAGDKVVSLSLRGTYPETQGGLAFFDSKEWFRNHPYLEVISNNKEVGIEWVEKYHGHGSDLNDSQYNSEGFYDTLYEKGWTRRFNWGDDGAFERDFEKESVGGWDYWYIDDVDFAWFYGHGNPYAFYFGTDHDGDGINTYRVHYTEAEWGDKDLEWIVIIACSILKQSEGGISVFDRWGWPVFKGLHTILGFASTAYDKPFGYWPYERAGRRYVLYMTDEGPRTITQGWVKTTVEWQDDRVWGAYLSTCTNVEDYLPGYGTVYPDEDPPTCLVWRRWQC